jgi:hypothetical protein
MVSPATRAPTIASVQVSTSHQQYIYQWPQLHLSVSLALAMYGTECGMMGAGRPGSRFETASADCTTTAAEARAAGMRTLWHCKQERQEGVCERGNDQRCIKG